jgi:hypothetical protein
LWEEETKFLQVTQPWQDELVDLALQVETKLAEFWEIQTIVVNQFIGTITKESLEQVRGSIIEMDGVHTKLNDMDT